MPKRKHIVILCVSLLAAVLVLAILLTVLYLVNTGHRVLSFHNIRISDEMYAWWQTRYRYEYLIAHKGEGATDTPAFWESTADAAGEDTRTHREVCDALTDKYVERIAIAAYLFDASGMTLTDAQKNLVSKNMQSIVSVSFGGSEAKFKAAAEKYGFTLTSTERAALLEYKASLLADAAVADAAQCDAYYVDSYCRVQMIYVAASDPDFTEKCVQIRAALTAADGDAFSALASDPAYNADPGSAEYPEGYYFAENSAFTEEYRTYLPDVADAALALREVGETAELPDTDGGIRFLRRYELVRLAYTDETYEPFFTDFSHDASAAYFSRWLDSYLGQAEWTAAHKPTQTPQGVGSDMYLFFR